MHGSINIKFIFVCILITLFLEEMDIYDIEPGGEKQYICS